MNARACERCEKEPALRFVKVTRLGGLWLGARCIIEWFGT